MTNLTAQSRWLSLKETCRFSGLSNTTIHRLRSDPAKGFPRPQKIGAKVMFAQDEIAGWLDSQPRCER